MAEIEPQAIRAHLDRIMTSRIFADSDRLRRFLRFTVESKLSAQHERVKEYVLGREVFDRAEDYDPRIDPIVRVEARRLRSKLQEYYSGPGREEKIRLEYQRGTYLPAFTRATRTSPLSEIKRRTPLLIAAGVLAAVVIATAFAWFLPRLERSSMVAAIPVQWIDSNPGVVTKSELDLAEMVNSELANRRIAPVLAWPLIMQHENDHKSLQRLAAGMGVSRLVLIAVRDAPSSQRVNVFLVDAVSGQKLRAQAYERRDLSSAASQQSLAQQIANDLAKRLQT